MYEIIHFFPIHTMEFSYRIFIDSFLSSFFCLPSNVYCMFFSYRSYAAEVMRDKKLMSTWNRVYRCKKELYFSSRIGAESWIHTNTRSKAQMRLWNINGQQRIQLSYIEYCLSLVCMISSIHMYVHFCKFNMTINAAQEDLVSIQFLYPHRIQCEWDLAHRIKIICFM